MCNLFKHFKTFIKLSREDLASSMVHDVAGHLPFRRKLTGHA